MTLLEYFPLFGLGNDGFFHSLRVDGCVLLYPGQQFAIVDIFMVCVKANGFYKFKVVPVNIALLCRFISSLLLASALLLFEIVVVEYFSATPQNLLFAGDILLQSAHLLLSHLQQIDVGCHDLDEVRVVFGGGSQELELRVVLLAFAECDEEVFAVLCSILGGVLDYGLLCL